ncbi:Rieske 2Fe-2S domain-containing protein [Vogesella sp. LIG4]|uniref:Rieske (2Fe-2S) protein n=1 Tax=Vogesella sp. LIG4 TaxID=1192162 RepID=UPI00081FC99B|nr:Rieske 2Fe-2S domain-containing protein [Vogesella sp. LIG4]SCK21307.1 Ferredoxin subunit of nitrite reductase or a ring-hydroxylating dioxygenase [Vogesella sp. LIG4]
MVAVRQLIARSDELQDGGMGVRFEVQLPGETAPAFAVRHGGQVHAYLNRCRHVPTELDWQDGRFFDFSGDYLICSLHGALYLPHSGQCVAGPCSGLSLFKLRTEECDGRVYCLQETDI